MRRSSFKKFKEHTLFLLMVGALIGIVILAFIAIKDGYIA